MPQVKWSLSQHISEHLGKTRLGDVRPPAFWPSEASAEIVNQYGETEIVGACRRAVFFRWTIANYHFYNLKDLEELVSTLQETEIPPNRYQRWIWEAGKLYEDFVVEMSKRSGVYIDSQIQIVIPQYEIVGKLDLIVRNPITGKYIAEEVKSIYGHNASSILGTPGARNKNQMGAPRDSNLMQIAIYDWHLKSRLPSLEESRLFYGARDTGMDAEFAVTTYEDNGIIKIKYQGIAPNLTTPVVSKITVNSILNSFAYIKEHFEKRTIPPRDYELTYSQDKIKLLYERDELGKGDSEQYEKVIARKAENEELLKAGLKPKKVLKEVEKGDWHCARCQYKNFCYDDDGNPKL